MFPIQLVQAMDLAPTQFKLDRKIRRTPIMPRRTPTPRTAFTMVELLVVIAIIGILVGLLVPAAMGVYRRVRKGAMKAEIQSISAAIEQYRTKYGDVPPDGSSWTVFERHVRKAFPQIEQSELDLIDPRIPRANFTTDPAIVPIVHNDSELLQNYLDLRVMEPGEALVFFLGGFSDDVRHPFTGDGGPFKLIDPSDPTKGYQTNVSRRNSFWEFDQKRLTVVQVPNSGVSYPITKSLDEVTFNLQDVFVENSGTVDVNTQDTNAPYQFCDLLPMYLALDTDVPYSYFDSRTYAFTKNGGYYFNRMRLTTIEGAARPYKSDTRYDSPAPSGPAGTAEDHIYRYMNEKTFQIISPGADSIFGGDPGVGALPVLFRFPSGKSDVGNTGLVIYKFTTAEISNSNKASSQADNITNFSETDLAQSLQ
jgi:prepilin-type N-terminal cleavage/methylation domain-containing protein